MANTLPENGKFLSTNGLTELIRLIKTEDNKKLENVKLNGTELAVTGHSVNITNATPSTQGEGGSAGLLSAQDKELLDSLSEGTVSDIYIADTKLDKDHGIVRIPLAVAGTEGTTGNNGAMSEEDKKKLDGIETGAQVNKIEKIKLNGTEATISEKTVNIPLATTSSDGLMSGADKTKVDNAIQGVSLNNVELTKDGNKKVNITIKENGTVLTPESGAVDISVPIKVVKQNGTALSINTTDNSVDVIADENVIESIAIGDDELTPSNKKVTIPLASTTVNGIMRSQDKEKLDGIGPGAQVNKLESISINGTDVTLSNKKALITAETSISDTTDNDGKLATIGAIKGWTDSHSKIEKILENGQELTITDKTVDVTVPYMELYTLLDGTETEIVPSSGKGVISLEGVVSKTDIQTDFSQPITDTEKVAQAKAIKEYVDSKSHLSFQILDIDASKDVYYTKDTSGNITVHHKAGFTPSESVIFLVPESGDYGSYIEYFYIKSKDEFEPLGRTQIDLSAYAKYDDFSTFSASDVDSIWNAN